MDLSTDLDWSKKDVNDPEFMYAYHVHVLREMVTELKNDNTFMIGQIHRALDALRNGDLENADDILMLCLDVDEESVYTD